MGERRRIPSRELLAAFAALPVANVSDCMGRMFAGGAKLRPHHAGGKLCGPALTVRTRPGDNLAVHMALDLAEPGDIVVVDAGGDLTNAIIGELMLYHAIYRKLGGIVINGAIRDSEAIGNERLPVYAAGVTHRGPYKDGPGEINVPIAIDGMIIEPGDVVIGDADGILAVSLSDAERVLELALRRHAAEEVTLARTRSGQEDRQWVVDRWRSGMATIA